MGISDTVSGVILVAAEAPPHPSALEKTPGGARTTSSGRSPSRPSLPRGPSVRRIREAGGARERPRVRNWRRRTGELGAARRELVAACQGARGRVRGCSGRGAGELALLQGGVPGDDCQSHHHGSSAQSIRHCPRWICAPLGCSHPCLRVVISIHG